MALDITKIEVPTSENWLLYDATGKNALIRNLTNVTVLYAYQDNPTEFLRLEGGRYIDGQINQPIYFKAKYETTIKEIAILGIVTGVEKTGINADELYSSGLQALFNRVRVVQAQKLFDNQLQYDDQDVFWDTDIVGTATSTHDPNNSGQNLTVVADGDRIIRQLREYLLYQSGNSQAIKMTYTPDINSSEIEIVLRSSSGAFAGSVAGTPFDYIITRAEWNYDKLDGNGISGINLDLSASQIFVVDLEWLSVGTVRYGFEINGRFKLCHTQDNANKNRGAYMTTANLPSRYMIERDGTDIIQEIGYNDFKNGVFVRYKAIGQTQGTLMQICTAVESEGGLEEPTGLPFSGNAGATSITLAAGASFIAVAQHQLTFKGIANHVRYIPQLLKASSTDQPILVEIIYKPSTVIGGAFAPVTGDVFDSAMERNVTATSITGGNVIYSRTILASSSVGQRSNSATAVTTLVSKLPFGIGINEDTPIPIAARITNIGIDSTDIYYEFEWKEIQ